MRRLAERPDLQEDMAEGGVSFDRVEALSRIQGDVGLMEWPISLRCAERRQSGLASLRNQKPARPKSVISPCSPVWTNPGGSSGGNWTGTPGALVDKVLTEAADALPDLPDGAYRSTGWRRATALVESLVSVDPAPGQVSMIVDAKDAANSDGEAGVVLDSGVTVGRRALQAILCDADTEVIARIGDGRFMEYGRNRRTTPPALKRALLVKYHFHVRCRWLRVTKPSPDPPRGLLGERRRDRSGQPGRIVLVPPSGGRSRTRLRHLFPQNAHPLPQAFAVTP